MMKGFERSIVALNFDTARVVYITSVLPPRYWAVVPSEDTHWVMDEFGIGWADSSGQHFVPWSAVAVIQQEPLLGQEA